MEEKMSLCDLKRSLPDVIAKQLRCLNIFNMCSEEHFPTEESCITFAQGLGLIPGNGSQIQHCKGKICRFENDKNWKLGYKFVCPNKKPFSGKKCLALVSPLANTFFEGSHLTVHDIFKLVMCFVSELTVKQVVHQLGLRKKTVIDWYVFCREVCEVILANEFQGKIGGEGMTVEVDESHLFRRKYGVGRKAKWEDQWLLGCYCRETKQCRIVRVKDRKRSTIMPLLLQFVDKNSTLVTDFAQIYKGCEKYGFAAHKAVCHKRYFVCPSDKDVNTNTIEATWRWRKESVLSCGDGDCVDRYLAESEYRHRYFHDMDMKQLPLDDMFLLFWYHIKLVYPGPGNVGLSFPEADDVHDDDTDSEGSAGKFPETLSDDLRECSEQVPPKKKRKFPPEIVFVSDDDVVGECSNRHRALCEDAKQLCRAFILNGRSYGSEVQTIELFTLNEPAITEMLGVLRSSSPQTCDEASMPVAKGLLKELHPSFRRLFTVIKTDAAGDCFYQAVSLTLFGTVKYMELIRLCSALMIIRYRDVFENLFEDLCMEKDFRMVDPIHFITVGCATPSSFAKHSLKLNKGRDWDPYSSTFSWANNITVLAFSLASQRPLYVYNSFRGSDGAWRHPANMALSELDRRSDIGGSVVLGHNSFANAHPLRLFLHRDHYSAIMPVVNTLNAQLKPSIVSTILNFSPNLDDQI